MFNFSIFNILIVIFAIKNILIYSISNPFRFRSPIDEIILFHEIYIRLTYLVSFITLNIFFSPNIFFSSLNSFFLQTELHISRDKCFIAWNDIQVPWLPICLFWYLAPNAWFASSTILTLYFLYKFSLHCVCQMVDLTSVQKIPL